MMYREQLRSSLLFVGLCSLTVVGKILPGSRPTHVNGVPLERDGDLNADFHNEIIVGPNGTDGNNLTTVTPERILAQVFSSADVDKDGLLDLLELQSWINAKVKEHFMQAAKDNFFTFVGLDTDHNGRVSWEEFAYGTLVKTNYSKADAAKYIKDLKGLPRKLKEQIMLDRAAWFESATDPAGLNIDEFLTFRHPEHSHVSLLNMVTQIISDLDTDGDGTLSEDEFSTVDSKEAGANADKKTAEKKTEFKTAIDADRDGKVTLQELLLYNDPMNPVHAKREAEELIRQADTNHDGKLSKDEVIVQTAAFMASKAVNTAKNIHEEF